MAVVSPFLNPRLWNSTGWKWLGLALAAHPFDDGSAGALYGSLKNREGLGRCRSSSPFYGAGCGCLTTSFAQILSAFPASGIL